jgi:hypothetical protein
MSCIETNDFAFQITEFMHEPRRIERIAMEYRLPKEEARFVPPAQSLGFQQPVKEEPRRGGKELKTKPC